MENSKKGLRVEEVPSKQTLMFEGEAREGALSLMMPFRDALGKAIKQCSNLSRYDIAARMSELVGRDISKNMLDKWTSSDPECKMGAEYLAAFCHVTQSIEPFRVLLQSIGCDAVSHEQIDQLRLLQLEERKNNLEREIENLKFRLGKVGS